MMKNRQVEVNLSPMQGEDMQAMPSGSVTVLGLEVTARGRNDFWWVKLCSILKNVFAV